MDTNDQYDGHHRAPDRVRPVSRRFRLVAAAGAAALALSAGLATPSPPSPRRPTRPTAATTTRRC